MKMLRGTVLISVLNLCLVTLVFADADFAVKLRSGELRTTQLDASALRAVLNPDQYVLMQFDHPLTDSDRERLASQGVRLLDYIPEGTYTARISGTPDPDRLLRSGVRWAGAIQPEQKVSPIITDGEIYDDARRGGDLVQYTVVIHPDQKASDLADRFRQQYAAEIVGIEPSTNAVELIVPELTWLSLSRVPEVLWIAPAPPRPVEHNNGARVNIGAEVLQATPYNLNGAGITVAEWDGGDADNTHPDLAGRVRRLDDASISSHATHVAGTVVGSGANSGGTYRGMAPSASIVSQLWWGSASEAFSEYAGVINSWNATIATNSWGYGATPPSGCTNVLGNYFSECATLDNIVRGSAGSPIVILHSAGNDRSQNPDYCGSIGWSFNTVGALASAKNVITVGAINSDISSMTSFSSWGPTDDGRVKPDVVGPGCQASGDFGITSTTPGPSYSSFCGTSMSTPATAGVVALLQQQYALTIGGPALLPSTYKGILINSAIDLGNPGPDYRYGHGKVDAVAAANKIAAGDRSYLEGEIAAGQQLVFDLTVPGNTPKLRVSLVWDDPGGTASASKALKNDLDLALIDPNNTERFPLLLDKDNPNANAVPAIDRVNNVESVDLTNPQAGLWKARVTGYDIPVGPQKFSLVFSPDSIHTPGNQRALAVLIDGPIEQLPGVNALAEFYVKNTGLVADSVHATISDNRGWLLSGIDSTFYLTGGDSVYLAVTAAVPGGLFAGDSTLVSCQAIYVSDTLVRSTTRLEVSVAAVHAMNLIGPPQDTVRSPETFPVSVTVQNLGNAYNSVTVSIANDRGWYAPVSQKTVSVAPLSDSVIAFAVQVPEEEPDQAVATITMNVTSSGGPSGAVQTTIMVHNPYQPPQLALPISNEFQQDRTPSFDWTRRSGLTFNLVVANDSDLVNILRSYTGISDTTFTMPEGQDLPDGEYYWGVKLYTATDSSSFQRAPFKLTIDNIAPYPAIAIDPHDSFVGIQQVTFTLGGLPGPNAQFTAPEFNRVQYSLDSTFVTDVHVIDGINAYTIISPGPILDGRLYWRAQRYDQAGNAAPFSAVRNFMHDTQPPPVPALLDPPEGRTVSGAQVVLDWTPTPVPPVPLSADYYFVHVSNVPNFADYTYANWVYADSLVLSSALLTEGQTYWWRVKALDSAGQYSANSSPASFRYKTFTCGDLNGDALVGDPSDLQLLVDFIFFNGPAPDPMESGWLDCDQVVDGSDLTVIVDYLFFNGPAFCCPL